MTQVLYRKKTLSNTDIGMILIDIKSLYVCIEYEIVWL